MTTGGIFCLLALLRCLCALATGASSAVAGAPEVVKAQNVSYYFLSGPAASGRFLGAQSKYTAIQKDKSCSGSNSAIDTLEECAEAATQLWPTGFTRPCTYPVWKNNIVLTDERDQPRGCLLLQNAGNGCGLRFNPTGLDYECHYRALKCTVVCEVGEPTTATSVTTTETVQQTAGGPQTTTEVH